jgi:hypothetical protein
MEADHVIVITVTMTDGYEQAVVLRTTIRSA